LYKSSLKVFTLFSLKNMLNLRELILHLSNNDDIKYEIPNIGYLVNNSSFTSSHEHTGISLSIPSRSALQLEYKQVYIVEHILNSQPAAILVKP